jgi:hypothetical protein
MTLLSASNDEDRLEEEVLRNQAESGLSPWLCGPISANQSAD